MPEPRAAGGAAVADGRIYVVGGVGESGLATTTLAYHPPTRTWETAPGLLTPREHLGVASDDERVFAVGGRTGFGANLAAFEVFDPGSGSWEALPDLPTARGGLAAAVTANGFLVAPGGEEAGGTFEEVEAYDLEEGAWLTLPPLPTARHGVGVAAADRVVFVVTGGPEPGFAFSAANEALDLSRLRPRDRG